MYPLNVTLIGCQDSVQRNVLSMLINQQATLDGQYADVDSAVTALRDDHSGQPRLYIMHVPDSFMLPKLPDPGAWVLPPLLLLLVALFDERPQPARARKPTTAMTTNPRFPAFMWFPPALGSRHLGPGPTGRWTGASCLTASTYTSIH